MSLRKWLKAQIKWAERRVEHAPTHDEAEYWENVLDFLTEQLDWLKGSK